MDDNSNGKEEKVEVAEMKVAVEEDTAKESMELQEEGGGGFGSSHSMMIGSNFPILDLEDQQEDDENVIPIIEEEPSITKKKKKSSSSPRRNSRRSTMATERTSSTRRTTRRRSSFAESFKKNLSAYFRQDNGPEHDWFIWGRRYRRRRRRRRRERAGDTELTDTSPDDAGGDDDDDIEGYQELVTNQSVINKSIGALRFAVFADTLNGMILYPNYALMALPEAHADSFPSTEPFGFSGATYFIPMTGLLGMAIAGVFSGKLSDKIGRKPVILACLGGSVFGSALKWFLSGSFWAFCSANFVNGLLSGSLPVALAYTSDLFASEKQKSKNFSIVVALYVMGQSTGGILGILLQGYGLFAPLWGGVIIMLIAFLINIKFLVEPGRIQIPAELGDDEVSQDESESMSNHPTEIDKRTMGHILFGAFVDIAGSKALFPICLSPLAFEAFYLDFVDNGQDPLMSINAYKWLTVLVIILVVPSSVMAPKMFQKYGLATGNVFGNAITGIVTVALMYIGSIEPATRATYAGFITMLYVGFPFTVFSQLAISPMLDRLAPIDQRGFVQGSFTTILNCGNAIAPWLLGMATDALGTTNGLWIGVGLSFAATLINIPLMFKKQFKAPPKKRIVIEFEDMELSEEQEEEYIQKALRGEYVPARVIQILNMNRLERGEKYIINHCGSYDDDKERLKQLCSDTKKDLKILRHNIRHYLSRINNKDPSIPRTIHALNHGFPDEMQRQHKEIGEWFGDYLKDNGYMGMTPVQNIKMMIIKSFPAIHNQGEELTPQNFEEACLNLNRLYNRHLDDQLQSERADLFRKVFKRNNGQPPRPVG